MATVQSATTVTATMKVSAKASTGTNLAVTVQNSGAAGAGKVTSKLLNIFSAPKNLALALWWSPFIGIGTTNS
jgi:phosphoglycerate-specific signal transduction histidine kinase